jgi:uroporphyrinogen decarboxylase
VFECVQDIVGLVQLSYISIDDPQLYTDLFDMVGDVIYEIWKSFLDKFEDTYVVCRFGDDLGFKTSTLISPRDIRKNIIPQYRKIVKLIHSYNKPFLLHSCGNIFEVMDDLIEVVGIDAKHSNEDQIAPFSTWLDKYGDRIGIFGGIDTDIFCQKGEEEIKELVREIVALASNYKGFALGSGNSIADYVPVNGYLAMIETVREIRKK